ncbi:MULTISPECIES: MarR family transcriptional regulator [unclassified Cryobacterium]|uniref:MarR family winged helix-turn-helix transcriptional regulator n=1 Tax=unclassified Cryobacterium TaxID=2649013 RepID=UPI002B231A8A|nr:MULTISPECIES: MarR family transcriptional regulator [unclassified Cryobacterium]MEA9999492.1 MarR family transcriptional regulator [Cryobacterium sp. RTS3]MEB0267189.1 MarR family transcriptional regulator [Cryobacterium sp. 10I5]
MTQDSPKAADSARATPGSTVSAPDLLRLEDQVCFALAIASRSVVSVYRPILEPYGLTHPQYLVLLALWERSPRSVSDLSTELRLEPATLSPLLKRLETAGLVARSRNTHDERVLDITLTDAGRALRADALTIPPRIIDRLGMTLDELTALRTSLWRVIDAAQSP